MNTVFVPVFILYTGGILIQAFEVAREVESGVELLNTGSIQLIIPKYLSFIIKNQSQCVGFFRTCYLSEPALSRIELQWKYDNVGNNCPPGYCTFALHPDDNSAYGLAVEMHEGVLYSTFNKAKVWCPLHVADGRSNFTIIDTLRKKNLHRDGAILPKDEETKPKTTKATAWLVPVCVGLVLLVIAIAIIGLYFCMRSRKQPVVPAEPPITHRRKSSRSKRPEPNIVVSPSQKTPTSKNTAFQEDSAEQ